MVRSAALLVVLLGVEGPAVAGPATGSMRIGAQVVASVTLSTSATARALGVQTRSFGCNPSAVFVQQRSGLPVRLRGGAHLPSETEAPLVMAERNLRLALRPAGPAEVVVTLFTDGTPPRT